MRVDSNAEADRSNNDNTEDALTTAFQALSSDKRKIATLGKLLKGDAFKHINELAEKGIQSQFEDDSEEYYPDQEEMDVFQATLLVFSDYTDKHPKVAEALALHMGLTTWTNSDLLAKKAEALVQAHISLADLTANPENLKQSDSKEDIADKILSSRESQIRALQILLRNKDTFGRLIAANTVEYDEDGRLIEHNILKEDRDVFLATGLVLGIFIEDNPTIAENIGISTGANSPDFLQQNGNKLLSYFDSLDRALGK